MEWLDLVKGSGWVVHDDQQKMSLSGAAHVDNLSRQH